MKNKFQPLEKTSASLFDAWRPEESASVGPQNDEIVAKRLSVWAIVATVSGAFSFFSLFNLGFLAFSIFAAFAAIFSLASISRSGGELTGRKFALAGLGLALAGAISGPVRAETYKAEFNRQADAFCKLWFDAVKRGDYLAARQMESPYWSRVPTLDRKEEVNYLKQFLNEEERHYGFHSFMTNPTLLTLVALGDRVKPSFYRTKGTLIGSTIEATDRVYALTVEPAPGSNEPKQTFFVTLYVSRPVRVTEEGERNVGWTIRMDEWRPMELDETGRPVVESDE